MKVTRRLVAVVAVVTVAGAWGGSALFWALDRGSDATWERIRETKVVRIGYAWEPPYAFQDDAGRVTGESPEVAKAILRHLDLPGIEWVQTSFGSLIPELRTGRFDMIAAGLFIRPDRAQLVSFSRPSACVGPALLVLAGNPHRLHDFDDLISSDARLAVLTGAVEGQWAREAGMPPERLLDFADPGLAISALRAGAVDALMLSGPTITRLAQTSPGMERARPFRAPPGLGGCAAFAFRQEDTVFLRNVDQVMESFIGSPEHMALIKPFGFSAADLPGVGPGIAP